MKSRSFIKSVLVIVTVSCITACTAFQPAPKPLPPIRVEYTLWWGDYVLLVAQEKGFFAEENVDVEPVYYEIFSDSYSDLAAGKIDAALIASGDAMSINRHTPVSIIGLQDDGGYMSIVARDEIQFIGELKGKTIGVLTGTQYELLVSEMFKSVLDGYGISVADVTIRNVNPEDVPDALAKNEIQAGVVWEPYSTQAIQKGAHILYPSNKDLRLFPDMIVFRQSVINQRPEEIKGFMRAWFKAVDYSHKNPEETRQIAAKYIGVPLEEITQDPNLKIFTYEDNLSMYNPSATEEGTLYDIMQKTAAYMISNGSLSSMPDIKNIITPKFLPQN